MCGLEWMSILYSMKISVVWLYSYLNSFNYTWFFCICPQHNLYIARSLCINRDNTVIFILLLLNHYGYNNNKYYYQTYQCYLYKIIIKNTVKNVLVNIIKIKNLIIISTTFCHGTSIQPLIFKPAECMASVHVGVAVDFIIASWDLSQLTLRT